MITKEAVNIVLAFLRESGVKITEKIMELVETVYPVVIKQVYVEIVDDVLFVIGSSIFILILLATAYYYFKKNKKLKKEQDNLAKRLKSEDENVTLFFNDEYESLSSDISKSNGWSIISFLFAIVLFLGQLEPLSEIIKRLINPNWYAAKMIFEMIQNKGF